MARTLIQPLQGTPAPLGARNRNGQVVSSNQPLRPGIGLLVASGASLGLWAGLAKLVLVVLH
jgi:hypothetical protein